jgi:hypothetical protein
MMLSMGGCPSGGGKKHDMREPPRATPQFPIRISPERKKAEKLCIPPGGPGLATGVQQEQRSPNGKMPAPEKISPFSISVPSCQIKRQCFSLASLFYFVSDYGSEKAYCNYDSNWNTDRHLLCRKPAHCRSPGGHTGTLVHGDDPLWSYHTGVCDRFC